jgi:hypothetical protein
MALKCSRQNAAGTGPLDPGAMFARGLNLAGALIDGAPLSTDEHACSL